MTAWGRTEARRLAGIVALRRRGERAQRGARQVGVLRVERHGAARAVAFVKASKDGVVQPARGVVELRPVAEPPLAVHLGAGARR